MLLTSLSGYSCIGSEHIAEMGKICKALRQMTHFSALLLKHLKIPLLTQGWWWDTKLRYWSVCVFIPNAQVRRVVPFLSTTTSKAIVVGLLFHSEINGWILVVEVAMECTELGDGPCVVRLQIHHPRISTIT